MKPLYKQLLPSSWHVVWSQSLMLGIMFLLFISNAIGLFEIKGDLLPGIAFNPDVFKQGETLLFPGIMESGSF